MTEHQENPHTIAQIYPTLKIIMDASTVGIVAFGSDARIVYANPLAEQLFGKSISEALGIKCGDFIGCTNRHKDPQGCGHTKSCPACPLFCAIGAAFSDESNTGNQEGECLLERDSGLSAIWVKYKVGTVMMEDAKVAIMTIDDITGRKQHEEKLRNALAELSVIHEHAPIAMILVDRDRRIRKINDFAARLAGRPAPEMIGLRGGEALRCLHHLDDPKGCGFGPACADCRVRHCVLDTFESGTSRSDVEAWLPLIQGESIFERCLLISTAHLEIDSIERVLVCIQDITDRKKTEEALKKREFLLNKIFDLLPIGLWFADKNGKILRGNPAGVKIWGAQHVVSMEEYGVFKARRLTSGQEIAPDDWALAHTIKKRITVKDELLEIDAFDGKKKIILNYSAPVLDNDGRLLGAIVMNNDITEQKQAEAALRESEEKYRRITENISDVVWITDLNLKNFYISPSVERLFGESGDVYMNRTMEERFPPDSLDIIHSIFAEELEKEKDPECDRNRSRLIEVEHYHDNGKTIWVSMNASFIRDKNGIPVGIQGVTRDITERKRAEEEHRKLQSEFIQAQKMESVGRLAGGVAHDYNNMLLVISGYAELAMERIDPDDPLYDYFKEILIAARRSTEITRQLLAFARKQTISPIVLDLNDTVESMLKMLRRLIGEDIDLSWFPESQLWPVLIDPAQIDQILANLCVNARDAIAGIGKITIRTENILLKENFCDAHKGFIPGDYVLLEIIDDGCGMDKETLNSIFEPFFTTKDCGKGTGLGLATVYGIVRQNRGFINVYSEPGEGATFKIYFPIHSGRRDEIRTGNADQIPAGHGETVLLVEDEPAIMKMSKMMLENLGYRVLAANTPDEAMRFTEEQSGRIHLLITDVIMPEMNGRDLADQLQSFCPDMKILFMSGYTANVIAHHGVLDKDLHFIQKPFSKLDIAVKIRKVLGKV